MGVEMIFRIAAIGILISVVNQILKHTGKEELATFTTLTGLIIVLLMVIDLISQLFQTVRSLFFLY